MVAFNFTLAAIAAAGTNVQLINSQGYALQIPFSQTGNLSPIVTDSSNSRASNQLWQLIPDTSPTVASGTYIVQSALGPYLSYPSAYIGNVLGGNQSPLVALTQSPPTGFTLVFAGTNQYYFVETRSGAAITSWVPQGAIGTEAPVILTTLNYATAQVWTLALGSLL